MKLSEYQEAASETDQFAHQTSESAGNAANAVPMLGLAGEVGTLLSEYKKLLRDGHTHPTFTDRIEEELGDLLWYVATVATRFGLSLDSIASNNLDKIENRWKKPANRAPLDSEFPESERLPQEFDYEFKNVDMDSGSPGVVLLDDHGYEIGDRLTDNAHEDDGYRFHDVMHFAFVAVLGWSPVVRKLLSRKRRSSLRAGDEVEDGGRAAVIDEAIVAMIFDYIQHDLSATKDLARVDSETLRSIRALTRGFEVHVRAEAEWEEAILKGLNVWRLVEEHGGGRVAGTFHNSDFRFVPPRSQAPSA